MGDGAVIFITDSIESGDDRAPVEYRSDNTHQNGVGERSPYGFFGAPWNTVLEKKHRRIGQIGPIRPRSRTTKTNAIPSPRQRVRKPDESKHDRLGASVQLVGPLG